MSTVVVLNEHAGGGKAGKLAPSLLEALHQGERDLRIQVTEAPGHAVELARVAAAEGVDRVIACGGDGTTFEVLNGLFEHGGDRPALGILPLGTGNSFLRDFGLEEPEAAIGALLDGRRRTCDVIRAEHPGGSFVYLNLLSVGFSARAGDLTNRRFKRLGLGGYALSVVACIARLQHPVFPHRLDEGEADRRPCTLLSFSNSRYTGGTMMMAPGADPSSGALTVIRIGPLSRRRFLGAFPGIYQGTHLQMPEVEQRDVTRVEFDLDDAVPLMVDGEVIHARLQSLEVLPGAIEVCA